MGGRDVLAELAAGRLTAVDAEALAATARTQAPDVARAALGLTAIEWTALVDGARLEQLAAWRYAGEPEDAAPTDSSTLDDEAIVQCPHCCESQLLVIDPETLGQFVQDCDVCCNPWTVTVARAEDGTLTVQVETASG